jgi:hypothetical protein
MATKPSTYLNWTDGNPSKQVQPPSAQLLSGWTSGEPLPFQYLNWQIWLLDQWIQWLDSITSAPFASKTANFLAANFLTYFCNPTAGSFTATLPGSAANPGYATKFKHTAIGSSNTVTVAVQSGDFLEGTLNGTMILKSGDIGAFQSDGAGNYWQVNT